MIKLVPQKPIGKWSVSLFGAAVLAGLIFYAFIASGERGGMEFFDNLKLALTGLSCAGLAIAGFFTGLAAMIKEKDRSILTIIATVVGFLMLVWVSMEIIFPH